MKSGMCIQRKEIRIQRLMESRGYSREKSLGIIPETRYLIRFSENIRIM